MEYYLPEVWSRLDEYVQWQVSTCREVLPAWNIYLSSEGLLLLLLLSHFSRVRLCVTP